MRSPYRFAAERLEDRWLLAITSAFDAETGQLSVEVDGPDDVVITEVLGQVSTEQVTSIVVSASGDFPNRFDLSFVDSVSFPALTRVIVRSGAGNDEILAPRVTGFLDGGAGDDTIVVDFQNLPSSIDLTTLGSGEVKSIFYSGIENLRAANAEPGSLTLRVLQTRTIDHVTTIHADGENTVVATDQTRLISISSQLIGHIDYEGTDAAADQLVLDLSQGNIIPAGGLSMIGALHDDNTLTIVGDGETTDITYRPSATEFGDVVIDVDGRKIEFTGLKQVNFLQANQVVVQTQGAIDEISLQNATLLNPSTDQSEDAIEISGTSAMVPIAKAVVRNNKSLVIDTSPVTNATAHDVIDIAGADNDVHGARRAHPREHLAEHR